MSEPPDLETLARRYLDLWPDQLAATAADPETADLWRRWFSLMGWGASASGPGAWAGAALRLGPRPLELHLGTAASAWLNSLAGWLKSAVPA